MPPQAKFFGGTIFLNQSGIMLLNRREAPKKNWHVYQQREVQDPEH
jgi:hypothetical protein